MRVSAREREREEVSESATERESGREDVSTTDTISFFISLKANYF